VRGSLMAVSIAVDKVQRDGLGGWI
jgi:hypothetical protein